MELPKRTERLEPSVTLITAAKAEALRAEGGDVLSLTVGEPDFATPEDIQEAAIKAIRNGKASYYAPIAGIPELRQTIVDYLKRDDRLVYESSQTVVTDGAKFALYTLLQTILDPQNEVIIPVPYWVSYGEQVKLAEGLPVFVKGKESDNWKVTVEQLERARSGRTRAVVINSPSNPTGMVYSKSELQAIGERAVKSDILIVAGDIYGRLVCNGNESTPIAMISETIKSQTIIVNGVSKTYAMTGWRIGYAVRNPGIINGMVAAASQLTSNPTAVSQYAAIETLKGEQDIVEEIRNAFGEYPNTLYPLMAELPGVSLEKPQGTFYLFPNVKETLRMRKYENVTQWVGGLLEEAGVAFATGKGLGVPKNVHMNYATDRITLEGAVRRVKQFIESRSQN